MNKQNKPDIKTHNNPIEEIESHSNESENKKSASGKMLENLSEECGNEGLEKNELYNNNAATVRIKNEYLMTHSINFDEAKETIKNKQIKDIGSELNDKKTAIDNNENSNNLKTGNLKEEVRIIEEHFINTNRDFKPILYDEDLNAVIEEEKLMQSKAKNNIMNILEKKTSNDNNEIINKFINNNFENNMFQNKAVEIKLEENDNNKEDINFKNTDNRGENGQVKAGNENNFNTLNIDEHLKDTNLVGNYRNEHFANTDDIMIVSFIEDKMICDRKGIFYGLNKIYLFINKKSGSQEGKTILDIAAKHHKNFEVKNNDLNVFNELYQNIYIIKTINQQTNNKSKETEELYVFVVDLLENDRKSSGIESLKIDSSQGKKI